MSLTLKKFHLRYHLCISTVYACSEAITAKITACPLSSHDSVCETDNKLMALVEL